MSYLREEIEKYNILDNYFSELKEYYTSQTNIGVSQEANTETSISKELNQIFKLKEGFIPDENWTKVQLISGRVIKLTKSEVACECIFYIDEYKEYQIRNFSRSLFEHLEPIKEGKLLKIKISQKPGSFRIDIIDGKGLGVEKEFSEQDKWNELKNFEMDDPF